MFWRSSHIASITTGEMAEASESSSRAEGLLVLRPETCTNAGSVLGLYPIQLWESSHKKAKYYSVPPYASIYENQALKGIMVPI